ncbi:MAG: hypothetical protein AAF797_02265 [Planctomycetota bacterium]
MPSRRSGLSLAVLLGIDDCGHGRSQIGPADEARDMIVQGRWPTELVSASHTQPKHITA